MRRYKWQQVSLTPAEEFRRQIWTLKQREKMRGLWHGYYPVFADEVPVKIRLYSPDGTVKGEFTLDIVSIPYKGRKLPVPVILEGEFYQFNGKTAKLGPEDIAKAYEGLIEKAGV